MVPTGASEKVIVTCEYTDFCATTFKIKVMMISTVVIFSDMQICKANIQPPKGFAVEY